MPIETVSFLNSKSEPSSIPFSISSIFSISFSRYERTNMPVVYCLFIKIACPLKVNAVFKISSFKISRRFISSSFIIFSYDLTTICGLKPKILFINSVLKPLITDITIIRIATPSAIPVKEKIETNFKKPSFFLGFKYLSAILLSIFEINLNFFC